MGQESALEAAGNRAGMALTKAEMADRLFEEVGLNKREAKEFVDAFFVEISKAPQPSHNLLFFFCHCAPSIK